MDWYEIDVDGGNSVKFNEKSLPWGNHVLNYVGENNLGGIIKNGEWAYLANNRKLITVSLQNGQTIACYEFLEKNGYGQFYIRHISEIIYKKYGTLLAVCLHNTTNLRESVVAIYSVEQNKIFKSIASRLDISSIYYISPIASYKSILQRFDGCLAVGTSSGALVLFDLNLGNTLSYSFEFEEHNFQNDCRVINYTWSFDQLLQHFDECRAEQINFGVQMEMLESSSCITSILPINIITSLGVGYADGKLVIYDLNDLQILHVAIPHPMQNQSSLVKMDYLEPPDDPRSCLYIWTMHESSHNLTAALHTLTFQTRLTDEDGRDYFKCFISGSIGLQLPLEPTKSHALSCQSIQKLTSCGENDSFCLSVLTWYSAIEEKTKLVVFDLNQWYKEEMPITLNLRNYQNYLSGFILTGLEYSLNSYVNPNSVAHFNSIQRIDEHFFPNSLSFDCTLLFPKSYRNYKWEGIQNKVINLLRCSNSSIFLEQDLYYNEIVRTRLLPQFSEYNPKRTDLRKEKYYAILSVALENNCINLLRDCAKSWSDGSFMGSLTEVTGLSLSLLTEWIMSRATNIKVRCNDLCKALFGFGGYSLECKEQKELGILTRQLKLLADLADLILSLTKRKVLKKDIEEKQTHLRAAAEYHEVLLWLFNIGLLPEASPFSTKINKSVQLVTYPYATLKDIYARKRNRFAKINDNFVSKKSGSCRLLFIDAFIEHECKGNMLREYWLENNGNGLYPPISIEYMLRLLLIPEIDFEKKCAILLYFFLDLNITVDQTYKDVVVNFIKFPSVFKLSASLIKTVETFWNLDHDQFLPAVNEFISPFNNDKIYPHWMVELLIEALLAQKNQNLALRIIGSYPTFVSPLLRLKTLLFNDLLSEAFHFARSKNDDSLLEFFFTCCLRSGKYSVIRDFALSEKEGQLIQEILKRTNTDCAESLNFVFLLQKSKYIDAFSYLDDLSKSKYSHTNLIASYFDTPNFVSAFNTTMTPVTQDLTDVFFRIRNKIKNKQTNNDSPVPFSCQLIKQNANDLLGGIYHSSALSAHFATCYFDEYNLDIKRDPKIILNSTDTPFLRKPQSFNLFNPISVASNTVSYPQIYMQSSKRSLAESELQDTDEDCCITVRSEHTSRKKRRLIGQDSLHELSQFKEAVKTIDYNSQNTSTITSHIEVNPNCFLTKPIKNVKQIKQDFVESNESCIELHSILKAHKNDTTNFHKEFVETEKNIRFQLPSVVNNNYNHSEDNEMVKSSIRKQKLNDKVKHKKIVVTECIEFDRENENRNVIDIDTIGCTSSKKIASKNQCHFNYYNKDSNNLSHQGEIDKQCFRATKMRDFEANDSSEENFFSPLSFQNTSFKLAKQDSFASEKVNLTMISEIGPKLRKHIVRTKVENLNENSSEKEEITKTNIDISNEKIQSLKKEAGKSNIITCNNNDVIVQSICFSNSKINEFIPKISSSKVCESQFQFSQEDNQFKDNILECTTIVDSLTHVESAIAIYDTFEKTQDLEKYNKSLNKHTETTKVNKMIDTTLDMSTYDFTLIEPTLDEGIIKISNINRGIQLDAVIADTDNNAVEVSDHINHNQNINIITVENSDSSESQKNNTKSSSTVQDEIYNNLDVIELLSSNDNSSCSNSDFYQSSDSHKSNCNNNVNNSSSDILSIDYDEVINHSNVSNSKKTNGVQIIEKRIKTQSSDGELCEDINIISGSSETDEVDVVDINPKVTELTITEKNYSEHSSINWNNDIDQICGTRNQIESCKLHNIDNRPYLKIEHDIKFDKLNAKEQHLTQIKTNLNTDFKIIKSIPKEMCSKKNVLRNDVFIAEIDGELSNFSKDNKKFNSSANPKYSKSNHIELMFDNPSLSKNHIATKQSNTALKKEDNIVCTEVNKNIEKFVLEVSDDDTIESTNILDNNKYINRNSYIDTVLSKDTNKNMEDTNQNDDNLLMQQNEIYKQYSEKIKSSAQYNDNVLLTKTNNSIYLNRTKRGISVPPQHHLTDNEETNYIIPTRKLRATSLQLKSFAESPLNADTPIKLGTTRSSRHLRSTSVSLEQDAYTRSPSIPHSQKISLRRSSAVLESIVENHSLIDSPSANTRSRTRLSSIDSEFNTSISNIEQTSLKRVRASSVVSHKSDQTPITPKRSRRSSISSQSEISTPKSSRQQRISQRKIIDGSELHSHKLNEKKKNVNNQDREVSSKKYNFSAKNNKSTSNTDILPTTGNYTTTRRLTRTQLSMFEKSSVTPATATDVLFAFTTKKIHKRTPSNNSVKTINSDNAVSVSSHDLSKNEVTRRITRSSTKDKDEVDDEVVSNVSSNSSSKRSKLRYKEKISPKSKLNVIPENEPERN